MLEQKQIKDYLHYYFGRRCVFGFEGREKNGLLEGKVEPFGWQIMDLSTALGIRHNVRPELIKPILRNLEDMTEEDMIGLLEAMVPHDMEDKPAADDFDVELFHNDGGNLVDSDVVIGAEYTCRCYVGQIAIRQNGDIDVYEDGDRQKVINYPQAFHYLLSRGFDLFGLIPASLAIDAKNVQP